MSTVDTRHAQARKLLERLIEISPDQGLTAHATKQLRRMAVPMKDILDKVEGDTIVAKAKRVGVCRSVIYSWLNGEYRPAGRQARRIARLTGFSVADVRGRASPDEPQT